MTYIPLPQNTEGDKTKIVVSDDIQEQLLNDVLKELKKMNIHLTSISDNKISDQEI